MEYQGIEVLSEVLLPGGLSTKVIQGWLSAVLNYQGLPQVTTLTCVISRMSSCKRSTGSTAVLMSQPMCLLQCERGAEFITLEDQPALPGDIIISLQTAERQRSRHPLRDKAAPCCTWMPSPSGV